VCILPGPADPEWMQHVARDMNLSETAFLYRENGGYNLRWFTPTVEVEICGHATLASAHILWEEGRVGRDEGIEFYTTHLGFNLEVPGAPWRDRRVRQAINHAVDRKTIVDVVRQGMAVFSIEDGSEPRAKFLRIRRRL